MKAPVWRLIAEHEIRTKLRDKVFLSGVGFSLAAIVVIFILIGLLGGRSDTFTVAVASGDGEQIVQVADQSLHRTPMADARAEAETVGSADTAREAVRDNDVDAALVERDHGWVAIGDQEIDSTLRAALSEAVTAVAIQQNADRLGIDLNQLRAGTSLQTDLLDPNAGQSEARSAVAFAFALVFFLTAVVFGMMIAQSVVREKESRVVEILAAAVPIKSMLWGKILGNTFLALAQVVLLVTVSALGMYGTGHTDLLRGVGPALGWYVAFFVLGFLAMASLWSVAGSLSTRQEDLQSSTLPAQTILFAGYLLSVIGNEATQTVMSMTPIISTMVMPGRMAQQPVPIWQITVAIGLTVVAAVVFVRLGTRLYQRSLLETGRRIGYLEAFKRASA